MRFLEKPCSVACFALALALHGISLAADKPANPVGVNEAKVATARAAERTGRWIGPSSGPRALAGKTIALVAEDLRNGGVVGVAQGVREATQRVGWIVKVFDAGGSPEGREKALARALAERLHGLVFAGADAAERVYRPIRTSAIRLILIIGRMRFMPCLLAYSDDAHRLRIITQY